jgi:hypothetical protein
MERNKKINLSFIFFMKLFEILLFGNIIKGCPVDEPILDSFDNCTSKYCTNDDFKNGECKIDNDIIRTQWLNRMNIITRNGFTFVSMAAYSDGSLILGTIRGNYDQKRYFYGLDKNGNNFYEGKYFILTNDIDFNTRYMPSLEKFSGIIYGNGYSMKNVVLDSFPFIFGIVRNKVIKYYFLDIWKLG